jgi:hypothetical protein
MGLILVVVLVVAILSFKGGMVYSKSKNLNGSGQYGSMMNGGNRGNQFGGTRGINGGPRNMMNGAGFTAGEIISKDDKSMTVKLQNGGSKIVFFGESTKVSKSAEGTLMDLSVGQSVIVTGKGNSDGSITAADVQLRPSMPKLQIQ